MNNFVQRGVNLTLEAPADVSSGNGVIVGQIFGVAAGNAAEGDDVDLVTEGVFSLAKVEAQAISVGAIIYYDGTTGLATTTATSNRKIGVATGAAANPSGTVNVRLVPNV